MYVGDKHLFKSICFVHNIIIKSMKSDSRSWYFGYASHVYLFVWIEYLLPSSRLLKLSIYHLASFVPKVRFVR